jgi:RNA polymerase sigma-70 factor (ECF subfamily)
LNDQDWLAERFEAHRSRLRGVAYRMLGSVTEADDAVQEAWIRLARTDTSDVDNLRAWLTTVVGRVCLSMFGVWFIRAVDGVDLKDPVAAAEGRPVFELHTLR